jgi:ribonuclease PH
MGILSVQQSLCSFIVIVKFPCMVVLLSFAVTQAYGNAMHASHASISLQLCYQMAGHALLPVENIRL